MDFFDVGEICISVVAFLLAVGLLLLVAKVRFFEGMKKEVRYGIAPILFFLAASAFYLSHQGVYILIECGLISGGDRGNWLVLYKDSSDDAPHMHQIVVDAYLIPRLPFRPTDAKISQGWAPRKSVAFPDQDTLVYKISVPMEEFLRTYKSRYGIPLDQEQYVREE